MLYKSSLVSLIAIAFQFLSVCLISSSLTAQSPSTSTAIQIPTVEPQAPRSNLITNNPFVPKNSGSLNQPKKNPTQPKSINNKQQVLQKYLQFKSIAIINKKKYFSIFNKRTNKSFWISENETVDNFRVTNYNRMNNAIIISDGINTETLTIVTASETPVTVVSAVAKPNNQDVVTPPTPGATPTNQNNKPKTPPRRRIIPAKR